MSMKNWKLWLVTTFGVVFIAGVAVISALWNNLSTEWSVEASAAQFALNHSALQNIQSHSVFTAAGAQEVFFGTDVFGQKGYAFVQGTPFRVHYQSAQGLQTRATVATLAKTQGFIPVSESIGYIGPQEQSYFQTKSGVIWEVHGRDQQGKWVCIYFNAKTGKELRVMDC
jgi:uncharacterized protein YpmB